MLRPFYKTRVLIDFDTFSEALNDGVLICTSMGLLSVIRVLIRSYGLREANWVTSYSEAGYIGPDETQFDLIDSEISGFLEETNDMTFCTEILSVLEDIANNMGGAGCGCGGAGAGSTTETPSTEQPGVPGNPQPGDEVPPGFADYAEYNPYKCDVAEWLVQKVETDLVWWATANFVTLATAAFIGGLVTPIPGDEVLALLGLLVALAVQGVTSVGVGAMIDALSNNRDAFLCALYAAPNAAGSVTNMTDVIDTAIDGETSAFYAPILKSILAGVFNTNNINHLYVKWEEKIPSLPTGDCSDCLCEPVTFLGTDNGGGNWDTEYNPAATDPPGKETVYFEFRVGGGASRCEVDQLIITPTNINPRPPEIFPGYKLYDAALTLIYASDTCPPSTDGVCKVVVQSYTVGEIDVTWVAQ